MNPLILGDCLEKLKELPENSIDAIVTDPPYGLSFMGKHWDYDVPKVDIWKECLRVLKPGGYLLSFAGTRTQHRMAVNIEDAGFEIRDMIAWVYGSGFPKSLNIGKAIDKLLGNERRIVGKKITPSGQKYPEGYDKNSELFGRANSELTKGNTEWEGWGTALKPALEPITVARKPISEKTVAENCLKWGLGGINIDECRVDYKGETPNVGGRGEHGRGDGYGFKPLGEIGANQQGRFPANFIHDGSDEVVSLFPMTKSGGGLKTKNGPYTSERTWNTSITPGNDKVFETDSGSASRFFYCAKASKSERNMGLDNLPEKPVHRYGQGIGEGLTPEAPSYDKNFHPTVKPLALMEYLIKLVSREGHTILDPFAGSGSTLIAAKKLKRNYIGIEREPDYIKIAEARISGLPEEPKVATLFN